MRSNQRGHGILLVALGVVILGVVGVATYRVASHHNKTNTTTTAVVKTAASSSTTANISLNASLPTGTTNANLQADLNNISGSINQENSDQSSANTAINDQQNEIQVPTI